MYFFFFEWRQASTNEINKILGKAWGALTKEERKYYNDQGDNDKLRFLEVSRIVDYPRSAGPKGGPQV